MLLAPNQGGSVRSVGGWSCSCRHGDSRLFVLSFVEYIQCGFGFLSFGFWGVGVRWLIQFGFYHLVGIAPPPPPTSTHDVEYLSIYISIGRYIPGRVYISIGRWCNMIAHPRPL